MIPTIAALPRPVVLLHRPRSIGSALGWLAWLAVAAVLVAGCATPWPALKATADTAHVAVAEFETWDAAHKRQLLAAHPQCRQTTDAPACFAEALAPYVAARKPVLDVVDALAPVTKQAAALALDAAADPKLTAGLAAKAGGLLASLLAAIATLKGAP